MNKLFALLLLSSLCVSGCNDEPAPGPDACIDPKLAKKTTVVTHELAPVCGCDGKTYDNPSIARAAGVRRYTPGECGGSN